MVGVGKIKQYSNVLDKPLSKGKQEVSLSAFSFSFSELVLYNQTQVDNVAELVRRFISIPKDMGTFNCGAFVAGIVRALRREARLG
ncbi:uncharacterized protein J3R85_010724 [Psidium guajava]|nr:uncharacterized protein J3R85_010724 [Psidium guajava]